MSTKQYILYQQILIKHLSFIATFLGCRADKISENMPLSTLPPKRVQFKFIKVKSKIECKHPEQLQEGSPSHLTLPLWGLTYMHQHKERAPGSKGLMSVTDVESNMQLLCRCNCSSSVFLMIQMFLHIISFDWILHFHIGLNCVRNQSSKGRKSLDFKTYSRLKDISLVWINPRSVLTNIKSRPVT